MNVQTDLPDGPITFTARLVFPVDAPPIIDGAVTVRAGRIVAVGRGAGDNAAVSLGNVAILPGFVNAHAHLEFSDLDEPLGKPGSALPDWIRTVVAHRRTRAVEPAEDRRAHCRAVRRGLCESLAVGTTALGEIATIDWTLDDGPELHSPVELVVFRELLGLAAASSGPLLETARRHVAAAATTTAWSPGLAPHTPFTCRPELIRKAVELANAVRVPVAMHLAESPEEIELLRDGTGSMVEMLGELDAWDPAAIARGTRPLEYLEMLARAERSLVIHGNYLDDTEIAFLARCGSRMSAVYCPRTHAFFGHEPFPLAAMREAGANVALGTDSRASNPDLSLLAEMRHVARNHPDVPPEYVLRMGTLAGAEALGLADQLGSLTVGRRANLVTVALPKNVPSEPHEAVLGSDMPANSVMIDGHWAHGASEQ